MQKCSVASLGAQAFLLCRYPYNLDFDFTPLQGLQRFSINNLGGKAQSHARKVTLSWMRAHEAKCSQLFWTVLLFTAR